MLALPYAYACLTLVLALVRLSPAYVAGHLVDGFFRKERLEAIKNNLKESKSIFKYTISVLRK